jgi:hypothetical protein
VCSCGDWARQHDRCRPSISCVRPRSSGGAAGSTVTLQQGRQSALASPSQQQQQPSPSLRARQDRAVLRALELWERRVPRCAVSSSPFNSFMLAVPLSLSLPLTCCSDHPSSAASAGCRRAVRVATAASTSTSHKASAAFQRSATPPTHHWSARPRRRQAGCCNAD